jgi:hypothetical protein
MSLKRMFVTAVAACVFSILVDAVLEGAWPEFTAPGLDVLVGGLVVLSLVLTGLQALIEASKSRRAPPPPAGPAA